MQKNILLADDDPAVRRMLCRVLSEENYFVIPVADADEALGKLKNIHVDLVLLDLALPEMGASESLVRRFNNERPSVPVILISSQTKENRMETPNGIRMEKPLDLSRLVKTIGQLLQEKVGA
jgi:DNA-binding response OmpR family regulator